MKMKQHLKQNSTPRHKSERKGSKLFMLFVEVEGGQRGVINGHGRSNEVTGSPQVCFDKKQSTQVNITGGFLL